MKTSRLFLLGSAVFLSTLNPQLSTCLAQGALTPPPGAPAPTMKTLDQIEARKIINATNTPGDSSNLFIISAPGSYYLTGNITVTGGQSAINITSSNVTLDLNGFSILSTSSPAAGYAIRIASTNVCIRDGNIASPGGSNTGFSLGISSGLPYSVLVTNVHLYYCGLDIGYNGFATTVERCTVLSGGIVATTVVDCGVTSATGDGIHAANVANCTTNTSGLNGINAITVHNSVGITTNPNGSACGVRASVVESSYGEGVIGIYTSTTGVASSVNAGTVNNSFGRGHAGSGVATDVATGCRGESDAATGLFANYIATNCLGISSSGRGVWTSSATNCYGQTTTGDYAILTTNANSCRGWQTDGSGVAIHIDVDGIAIGCTAPAGGGTIELGSGAQKYLMP